FNPLGYLALLAAAVSDAVFLNLSRRFGAYTGVEKSYVMAGLGAVIFTGAAFAEHGAAGTVRDFLLLPFRDSDFLFGCLYLSVGCSVFAFIMRNVAVSQLGPGRAGSFAGVTTLVSVLAGVLLLGEGFSPLQGIGTLLVLLGIYGANTLPAAAQAVEPIQTIPAPLQATDEKED
ncbi:MAG: DMT family transporter, partial [Clostridia bacterium]|nr:DMT family transporter [Clostridia bacterium]